MRRRHRRKKRRLLWVGAALLVLAGIGVGVALYLRANSSQKLLARARLALRSNQPQKAAELAARYTDQRPDDWRGYHVHALAACRQGLCDKAREVLAAAERCQGGQLEITLCKASTYSLPAKAAISGPPGSAGTEELAEAADRFEQANGILRSFKPEANEPTLRVQEHLGLNLHAQAIAQMLLAEGLAKEARTARSAGADTQAETKDKQRQEALAACERTRAEAVETLLAVVQKDARRPEAAETLIQLCDLSGDEASLAAARKAILALPDPPAVAAMTLTVRDLRAAQAAEDVDFPVRLAAARKRLEELAQANPDNARIAVEQADLALLAFGIGADANGAAEAQQLSARAAKADPGNAPAGLIHARALMLLGQLAKGEQDLFVLKNRHPRWALAQYHYALAAEAMGKQHLATEAMRRIVTEIDPNYAPARKYLARASLAGASGNAYEDARAALAADPNDTEALGLVVRAAVAAGRQEQARAVLAATEHRAGRADLLLAVADGYRLIKDDSAAREAERRAAGVQPRSIAERNAVAAALVRVGRAGDADALLLGAVEADPNNAEAHFALAQHFRNSNRGLRAFEHYRKAVDLSGRTPKYRLMLAGMLVDSGQYEKALDLLGDLVATNRAAQALADQIEVMRGSAPGRDVWADIEAPAGPSRLMLARAYLAAGQPEQALEICDRQLQRNPENLACLMLKGMALFQKGNTEACIETWSKGITAEPRALRFYLMLSGMFGAQNKPATVHHLIWQIPGARKAMVDLAVGALHERRGEIAEAAKLYASVADAELADESIRYSARLQQVRVLAQMGQADAALAELDKLIDRKIQPTETRVAKAALLGALGRRDEAAALYGALLAQAKARQDAAAIMEIAFSLARTGRAADGLAALDVAERLRPRDPSVQFTRAKVLLAAGQPEKVPEILRKAISLQPDQLRAYVVLAETHDALNEPLPALAALRELSERGEAGRDMALYHEGRLFQRWGLHDLAAERFEAFVQTVPGATMGLDVARRLAAVGRKAEAKRLLERTSPRAAQYTAARQLLADIEDTSRQRAAVLESLADQLPNDPGLVNRRMAALTADDRPDEAVKAFWRFLAAKKGQGPILGVAAATAVRAAVKDDDLPAAAQFSAILAESTRSLAWRAVASALAIEMDANAAGQILPEPGQADFISAALGLAAAAQDGNAGTAKAWAGRIEQIFTEGPRQRPPLRIPPAYALLCAMLAKDKARADAVMQVLRTGGPMVAQAGEELIARAAKADDSAEELGRLLRAQIALDVPQFELAQRWALEALKARPTCQWAVVVLLRTGPGPEQIEQVAAIFQPQDSYLGRLLHARNLTEKRQFAEAAKVYQALCEANSDNPGLLLDYARAEENAGRLRKALGIYRQAWEVGKDPSAGNNWAYLVARLHADDPAKLAEADRVMETVLQSPGASAMYLDTAGWIAHLQGRRIDSVRLLRQAVKALPGSAEVHYHLGLAEAAQGSDDETRRHARRHLSQAVSTAMRRAAEAQADGAPMAAAEEAAGKAAENALLSIQPAR